MRFDMPGSERGIEGEALPSVRGELRTHEPMSKHTSWRAGGNAEYFYIPADKDDLAQFLRQTQLEPIYMVGLGSNLLVRDGGVPGIVVALHARLNDLWLVDQSERLIYAGAGVACAKIARFAAKHDLAGAEFLAGIPGTVGGALAMNAGCFGVETWKIVERVEIINRSGVIFDRLASDYETGYRSVRLRYPENDESRSEWFAGCHFRLQQGVQAESRERIKQLLAQRMASQPLDQPNAGSVFRNPPGDYAARLIESCDLKGRCIGGAMVSPKHANFIVNMGNARASNIEALILLIQDRVKQQTGVELIPEVRMIGDAGRLHSDDA
ncbi:UDP-N-acetylmuramate dehydrogenase [Nitrosomonas sp. JL21]|uniref:UDP-N-acetylmuramate dehydrogenase n=1 Tax=Nitrosomonas sp. JL21 TaxID=153949 RepID=UPI00136A961E|nr:UDP-N-acetylmuramate dehydrogenase [Nitrosomonas sp. JL21]MBL8497158.1 UDP-N-acetylmuramate dehydrogenase [Nitrosomonas sp.]MCC7092264.1 UDP-N-acetylmuramate dehydrogenase [Nitrosomonas sp.]MXS76628.1 UDP-N-acetylmuramate dehydrogenase [Nitrosomonas sp. JL21]